MLVQFFWLLCFSVRVGFFFSCTHLSNYFGGSFFFFLNILSLTYQKKKEKSRYACLELGNMVHAPINGIKLAV